MVRRLIEQSVIWFAVMTALLFIPAGTLAWTAGWVYLAELLAERMSPLIQREQKTWDKVLMTALIVLWCAWFVVMGLDAVRFGWSRVPLWLQVLGALAILTSMHIIFLTVQANTFAAPVVKIQKERGHSVVSHGPYAIVRHPMYAGALLLLLVGTPLLLGSWWGLAIAPIIIALLGARAVGEERMLKHELEGYGEYAMRVRYRFIPMIW
ncbi:MAG TPA: isoprenylcysteine carboxylmethyltransferase family protein [Dongiaceae bacterium]|jgi:protein-S-isoprenylcysteine O-methyltransferase Ste14|nr:isoprenylcysteine carboxylmethyltransferase family protein [Dongiaceae bacterium]